MQVSRAWRIASAAIMLAAGGVVAAVPGPDPWAPGTSQPAWPLISTLQSSVGLGSDERAWEAALGHPDPLARAAAAWAVGRTKPPHASRLLGPLVTDAEPLVRDAALWGVLALDDEASLISSARALAARRHFSRPGTGGEWRRPGEPPSGFGPLFARRGIPWQVVYEGAPFRREWLASVDLARLRPEQGGRWTEPATFSIERSEWDAGERASIRATVTTSATAPSLRSRLVPLDEPDGIPDDKRHRIPVVLRRAEGEPRDALPLASGTRHDLELALSLHEIPPGPYQLDGLDNGHPLLLRVRRSPRREAELERAAEAAQATEEIEAIGWQRLAAAAPRLRERLRTELAGPRGSVVWPLLRALARVEDPESAGLLIDALHDSRGLATPGACSSALRPEVRAFGPASLPHLVRIAHTWPEAVRRVGRDEIVMRLLGAASVGSPELDEARMEALRTLAPMVTVREPGAAGFGWPEANRRDLFLAALVGVAPRRPREVGTVLATLADRPAVLARAIDALDPVGWDKTKHPVEADAIESILTAAWSALDPHAPADARSALHAEAERLGIPLAGRGPFLPASSEEASRELSRGRQSTARGAREAMLHRVLASPPGQEDAGVVRQAAQVALELELFEEAARLVERALQFAAQGRERGLALFTRSRVRAALGDRAGQRADLEAAVALGQGSPETLTTLEKLRSETAPDRLRVRQRSGRQSWNAVAFDGSRIVASDDLRIERQDVLRGGTTLIAVAPWRVRALAVVDTRSLMAVADDGSLALLRQGKRRPVWEAQVDGWCTRTEDAECDALAADRETVVVRDLASRAHAFDAATGRKLWTSPAADGPPVVVNGSDPVVLATPRSGGRQVQEIVGVHPRSGRALWSARLSAPARSWAAAAGRVAWVDMWGGLRVVDVRTGREVIRAELLEPRAEATVTAVAIAPQGSRVYAAIRESLFAVDGTGVAWSHVPSPAPDEPRASSVRLRAGGDALWRVVTIRFRAVVEAWSPSGARIAERRWSIRISDGPRLVDEHVVEVLVGSSTELLDVLPAPPP